MIETRSGGGGTIIVTFRLPRTASAEGIRVVGDFNDWSRVAHPMEPREDEFVAEIAVPVGRVHRFRYLLDGDRWENDWAADFYVANEFGGDDSVIDLTPTGPRAGMVHDAIAGWIPDAPPFDHRSAS